MPIDPVSIARASYDAYVRKDRSAVERLIAADFHFSSPLDNRIDRDTYFSRCWPNSQTLAAFDLQAVVRDGDKVFVNYEGRKNDGGRFRNTEILTIRNDQIVEVEVYFGWSIPHPAPAGSFTDAPANAL